MSTYPGKRNKLIDRLTGDPVSFSMENRAFNYVCVVTFIILFYALFYDIYISLNMGWIIGARICVLGILYYYARVQKKYHAGIVIYAIASYAALMSNYYTKAGIDGPSISVFFLTFHLLIATSKPRQYKVWIILHISVVLFLLASEYVHPEWVAKPYPDRFARFIDIAFCYVAVLIFIFAITNMLRVYYNNERLLAEERATILSGQNTQIVLQNKSLEKHNDEKNKLFSIISHDLKTPLDSLKGYLEILAQQSLPPQEKAMIEEELLEQTKYTSDLLLNLLSWAKAQMQGVTVNLTTLYLSEIVEKATSGKMQVAAKKGIKLTYSIDPKIEVIGDKDMMDIVVRNLVNNAIKFTNPGGEVYIRIYKGPDETGLAVQDTGIGIPPGKRDEIFTLKTRSTFGTANEKGIGLGLMMCKEFMDYQHGKIWFDSQEGVGSVFYVTLPSPKL